MNNRVLLQVEGLKTHFVRTHGLRRKVTGMVKAVDGVNLQIRFGETVALVGESGSGKTTLGRSVLRAIEPTSGSVTYHLKDDKPINFLALGRTDLKEIRRHLSMVFQDPYSSLNPRMSVLDIVGEPLVNYGVMTRRRQVRERVAELLRMVRLEPEYMGRYPHAFSGGQRQRIAIARALSLDPQFIVLDEPVSALDVSVQAQVLNLLKELQDKLNLTYLFIAHNLAVIEYVSSRVAVMYVGRIVEVSETQEVFRNPRHPYTEALLSAVPKGDPDIKGERIVLEGDVADPANPPSGCYFHPRCRYAQAICRQDTPELSDVSASGEAPHLAACHFAKELKLAGVRGQDWPRKGMVE